MRVFSSRNTTYLLAHYCVLIVESMFFEENIFRRNISAHLLIEKKRKNVRETDVDQTQ